MLPVARAVVDVLSGKAGGPAALATVVGRSGSAPQVVGARLLLREDGVQVGTVGGGAIEEQVLDACRACLRDGSPRVVKAHLVRDLGMCCGGAMEVFVEYLAPEARLVLVGAGHVAQAVAPVAAGVGFRVVVVDDREDLLGHPAFAAAERHACDVDELDVAVPDLGERDYIVILTRDHARDERALAHLVRRPHRYLGMIGSVRKVHAIVARVLRREHELGRPAPDLTRVRAPVGIALGGRTPAEIAVSIVAELVADRHGGSGAPMNVVPQAIARLGGGPAGPLAGREGDARDDG
ncbi:XdhC family protein [Nannocystis pusilla]|uniref:XdhC/CoxI family protein n=1 Tax=Nannocystis pusilla TaxID=889268 RepID=A0ABS7TNK3_9BACT|nr:XdhC/CoxI family protein [Nannocystis pusilla]